jgi:SlyX protein
MEERLEAAEVQIAYLNRSVEELSDVVARQANEINALNRQVRALLEAEEDRLANGEGPPANQRPPHW